MLEAANLIGTDDYQKIADGLETLGKQHAAGEWSISLDDEDVHTALERRLTDLIGDAGGRVHLGRSRNDQVLAALRLYLKDAAASLGDAAEAVAAALESLSENQGSVTLPGYTHMQQAMPSSVALWAGGIAAELKDDAAGVRLAARRADRNPLGSAAGYGTPGLAIDRAATASALGFAEVHEPVTAVQLSRGKAEATLVFEISLLLKDLGRLASDLLLFYTQEFGYVSLPDSMTTGSSIMPQKRNPDVLELVRAAGATVTAALLEIIATTASLGTGYQRDLQRIKAPLFRAIDIAEDACAIMRHLIDGVEFVPDAIRIDDSVHAAERAYRLVTEKGLSFRDAYRQVADDLRGKD
jgi:argininosuccinate lyase